MLITVFTPAYNRAHLLPRVYESLCKQTFRDFEWLVVDDGSKDDTRSVVDKFRVESLEWRDSSEVESIKNEVQNYGTTEELITLHYQTDSTLYTLHSKLKPFPIRYFYQENGGKHRAINHGVREAQGELFFIVDSDDYLSNDALEKIARQYEKIANCDSICGVSGMRGYSLSEKIGSKISFGQMDCTMLESSWKYHVYGDKAEAIRTKIMKEFPFPEFEGEKFCPEALIWNRISTKYKIRYFDEIIYLCEYLPDGLTSKISKLLEKNIKSTMIAYKEMNEFENVPFKFRIRAAINYYRYTLLRSFKYDTEFRLKLKWIWTLPLGIAARIIKG